MGIASQLVLGLGGGLPYPDRDMPWPNKGELGVISSGNNWTISPSLRMIGRGDAEAAITTPPATAYMARKGIGHFVEKHELSAVARLPHRDWLGFAVREDSGIESLKQIREENMAIKLARTPSQNPPYSNLTGFLLDEVLKHYGISTPRIKAWGGQVNDGGRKLVDGLVNDEFDAVFDEAMMSPEWNEITQANDFRFLPVDEEVITYISELYGIEKGIIPEDYLPGVEQDTPTIDMSGWLLVIDSELSDAVGYHVAQALDNRRDQIHHHFDSYTEDYTNLPLSSRVDMNEVWKDTKIPLHPGAEIYYEEQGYK